MEVYGTNIDYRDVAIPHSRVALPLTFVWKRASRADEVRPHPFLPLHSSLVLSFARLQRRISFMARRRLEHLAGRPAAWQSRQHGTHRIDDGSRTAEAELANARAGGKSRPALRTTGRTLRCGPSACCWWSRSPSPSGPACWSWCSRGPASGPRTRSWPDGPPSKFILGQNFVRGMISGIGLVDVWIGFSEAVHYRDLALGISCGRFLSYG